jgi:serine/threonine protein kinase
MINKYKVLKELGKGAFGKVILCWDSTVNITENLFAIKIMNKKELKKRAFGIDKNAYDCVLEELKIL